VAATAGANAAALQATITAASQAGGIDEQLLLAAVTRLSVLDAQQQQQQQLTMSGGGGGGSSAAHLAAKAQNAMDRDGFALTPLLSSDMTSRRTLSNLAKLLETEYPDLLGKGKDVQKVYGPYDRLQLACAWKIDHPRNEAKYQAGLTNVQKEMDLLEKKGKDVSAVPGLPTRTAQAGRGFALKQDANETILLHGTQPDRLLALLSTGLNERFSGTNAGTAFGDGVYLAEDVGKTDQYVTADCAYDAGSELHQRLYGRTVRHPGDVFYLLVCRTALGYPVRTQESGKSSSAMDGGGPVFPVSFRELAPVPSVQPPILHHSLIAERGPAIARYREFIVFHGDYVYPEFLIAYQRFNGDQRLRTR